MAVIKISQDATTHTHTYTQAHHCSVTATIYFWKPCLQPSLPSLSSHSTHPPSVTPCHCASQSGPRMSGFDRKWSWQPTNQLITTLSRRTLMGLIVDKDAVFMAIYGAITAWLQLDMGHVGASTTDGRVLKDSINTKILDRECMYWSIMKILLMERMYHKIKVGETIYTMWEIIH